MKKLISLVTIALIIISCQEKDDYKVTLDRSGQLEVKVVDHTHTAMTGAEVIISASGNENRMYYHDSTNQNGVCDVGKMLKGEYLYRITGFIDNRKYQIERHFQVASGENNRLTVNPVENSGVAIIKIVEDHDPVENIQVALIPHYNFGAGSNTFQSLKKEAYYIKETDNEGEVRFDRVPAKYYEGYSVMAYYDASNYSYPTTSFKVPANEVKYKIIEVYL